MENCQGELIIRREIINLVVIVLENASDKLRGILTRWMIEMKPGIFVGSLNKMVREKIWEIVEEYEPRGALLLFSYNNEQGYQVEMLGEPNRLVVDLD